MKLSVITPSFNQGAFIEKTIQSVLNQDYTNVEYIIIDGGSTDDTIDIIKKYADKISYWISEKDNGQSHALNKGFEKATGDIIGWINSDDWYEPGVFGKVIDFFSKKRAEVVVGNCKIWRGTEKQIDIIQPRKTTFQSMTHYWKPGFCPPQPSIFFSAKALRSAGCIDEELNYAMDLDLWLRMAAKFEFTYVPFSLSNYLIHDSSKTGSGFDNFLPEWQQVCEKYIKKASLNQQVQFKLHRGLYFVRYSLNAIRKRIEDLI